MLRILVPTAMACAIVVLAARPSIAVPQFQKVFWAEYIEDHADPEFTEFVKKKVKCYGCHQGKKSKKNRNVFGEAMAEHLDAKKDKKDVKKITEVLAKVIEMPSDPDDENSATFAELIESGKLPAGELEALKEEPES